ELTVTPSSGPPGTAATLTVTIRNIGAQAAGNLLVDGSFGQGGTLGCGATGSVTETIASLAAGASLTFSYPFNYGTFGYYYARAFVDSQCAVAETSETNNQASRLYRAVGPDLTVTGLTVTPSGGPPGTAATLTVTIRNIGALAAGN